MIDACDAEYNAIKSVFPNITVLMSWFHVMKNAKKAIKRFRISDELANMLKSDIQDLHVSLNFDQFNFKLEHVKKKWAQYSAVNYHKNYFFKEWIIHSES